MSATHFCHESLSLAHGVELVVDVEDEVRAFEHGHVFPVVARLKVPLKLSELRHAAEMEAALNHQLIGLGACVQVGPVVRCFCLRAGVSLHFRLNCVDELF